VKEGGQPASLSAWLDPEINASACGFFSETLETLQKSYVRPRFNGFVRFFETAGIEVNRCLKGETTDLQLIDSLNKKFSERLALAATRA
jgi:multiple sugar transport system substrate-binding protein